MKVAQPATAAWPRRIVVATDGSSSADAALRATRAFAARTAAAVQLLAVYTPRTPVPFVACESPRARCAPSDRREIAQLIRRVRAQVRQTLDGPGLLAKWPVVAEIGDPGSVAARVADEFGAELIVVGLGASERRDRHGGGTALCVARYATVPLYAALSGGEMPTRGLVPIVDDHLHVPTLRATASCLAPGGRMVLVYFGSSGQDTNTDSLRSARHTVEQACGPMWKARLDQLDIAGVDMDGDATAGTLRLAEDVHAELIAVPNYGDPGPVRVFIPNLVDSLLLAAHCSVLVVPDWSERAVATTLGD